MSERVKEIGIVLFDDVEELDFAGPWEVFTMAASLAGEEWRVSLLAEHDRPVRCAKKMRVLRDRALDPEAKYDILVVPGGDGRRREVDNPVMIDWLRRVAPASRWVTSVCTGVFLLHRAGIARNKRVTTHWSRVEELRKVGDIDVREGPRFVRDGNLVTAAGVSAGIDMALWIVGQERDPAFARGVQKAMEYNPSPPYAYEA
jgi:transcriptional regulator GlxA family with amidase domain